MIVDAGTQNVPLVSSSSRFKDTFRDALLDNVPSVNTSMVLYHIGIGNNSNLTALSYKPRTKHITFNLYLFFM